MRILLAALAIAVVAGTVHAQDAGGGRSGKGRGSHQNANQQADPKKQKELDPAYKAGINRIPDATGKYDPWKNTR
jgi:hypothetical protein